MTRSELMAWINERLQRRDLILEDDEEDSSSYPIIALVQACFVTYRASNLRRGG